jgi:methionyl-tRNA formyltransferase
LFTHQDDPHEEIWWNSCAGLARQASIPVCFADRFDGGWLARIAAMRPTVIYSFSYRNLLPEPLLRLPLLGAFNLHPSLLPKYRGRAPVNWMIINGERQAGVTLHHMTARADAGDIVGQQAVEISEQDTALTLYHKLVPAAASLLRQLHPLIAAGCAPRHKQDLSAGSYYGRRRPEHGRINWHWPARRIYNLVRAVTHPYPGAFCFFRGHKLMIWETRIAHETGVMGESGNVIGMAGNGGVEVAAGDGSLVVVDAQFESEATNATLRRETARQLVMGATQRLLAGRLE